MVNRYRELSEIVAGKVIKKDYDSHIVNPSMLMPPYNKIVSRLQENNITQPQLMIDYGWDLVTSAVRAAEVTSVGEEYEWIGELERISNRYSVGIALERASERLRSGEDVDEYYLQNIVRNLDRNKNTDIITLADIEPEKDFWTPSYYQPFDNHIGGYPKAGLTIVAGPAGLGKTTLLLKLLRNAALNNKRAAFFSLEMTLQLALARMLEVDPDLTVEARQKIIASEYVDDISDLMAKVSRIVAQHPDIYLVGIDYADKILKGEQSEATMGEVYEGLATLAKELGIVIVLIAGMSRGYVGGEPMVNHIRYSGRAEHAASLIILLYNPDLLAVDMGAGKQGNLPYVPGYGWMKVGKSRFGLKEGEGLIALQVEWLSRGRGWADEDEGVVPLLSDV